MKKNRNAERRRRENRGAEHRGAEGAEDRGAVGAENQGAEGGGTWGGGVFLILDHEIAFLAHSGRYILQFRCLLYAQNPPIYRG